MKKYLKHFAVVFALAVLACALYAAPAQAANRLVNFKMGSTVKPPSDHYDLYKVTVAKDGILQVTNKSDWSIHLYKKYKKSGDYYYVDGTSLSYTYCPTGKTTYITAKKGSYYFDAKGGSIKIKYIKPVNKANYTRKKAISLAKNKMIVVSQLGDLNYNRWYKITLKKKQSITITSNDRSEINLYDKNGIKVETISDSSNSEVEYSKPVAKGTYYLRVSYIDTYSSTTVDDLYYNRAITLKWK